MKSRTFFGSATLLTGLFACLGSLYSWGDGPLFTVESPHLGIIVSDLIFTAPLSLVLSWGIFTNKKWAASMKLVTVGVYVYGSILVYVIEFLQGAPYNPVILILPVMGLLLSAGLLTWKDTDLDYQIKASEIISSNQD